jgi:hypothetical protein
MRYEKCRFRSCAASEITVMLGKSAVRFCTVGGFFPALRSGRRGRLQPHLAAAVQSTKLVTQG